MAINISLLNSSNTNNINTNFTRVATALQDAVGRAGSTPNQMNADFDMNNNDILNIGSLEANELIVDGLDLSTVVVETAANALAAEEAAEAAIIAAAGAGVTDGDKGGVVVTELGTVWTPKNAPYTNSFVDSLVADGVTNDVAALVALEASAQEVIRLKNATYYIGTNYTPSKTLRFSSGTRMLINEGVTVDFSAIQPEINDEEQHFEFDGDGSGIVTGLRKSFLGWFAGDARGSSESLPTVECRSEIQRAFDAVGQGLVRDGGGHYLIDGSVSIDISAGQTFHGAGNDLTVFRWQGTACEGFDFAPGVDKHSTAKGFCFRVHTPGTIPTSGTALKVRKSYTHLSDYFIDDCYNGVAYSSVVACWNDRFQIIGAARTGLYLQDASLDIHVDKFIIQALYDWVDLGSITGTFEVGESLTVSSGQTGVIISDYTTGRYRIRFVGPKPAVSATIEGDNSGATGTITAITAGHALGGLRLDDNVEAFTIGKGDVLGGEYSLATSRTGTGPRDGAAYNRINDVYFDSAYNGSLADGMYGVIFNGTWFASAANSGAKGILLVNSSRIHFNTPQFVNNADAGISWDDSCQDIHLVSPEADGNCVLGGSASIDIGNDTVKWSIIGGRLGGEGANGITPPRAISIGTGTHDSTRVIGVDVGGTTSAGIINNGTLTKIRDCPGFVTSNSGSTAITTDGDGEANIPHGLAGTPASWVTNLLSDTVWQTQVISLDGTNLRVRVFDSGGDKTGVNITVYWRAEMASAA